MEKKERSLAMVFDPSNWASMRQMMREFGDGGSALYTGNNVRGEDVTLSFYHEKIVYRTFQNNGWVRKNVYWNDGTSEEMYEGRWDKPNGGRS